MINQEYFKKNGWNTYNQKNHICHPSAHKLHQRRQRDSDGQTLFFWNVWEYPEQRIGEHKLVESWVLDMQLNTHSEGTTWNISTSVKTPQELEVSMEKIMTIWMTGEWVPYDSD